MKNKEGFVISTSLFAIMLITLTILLLSYRPILNGSFSIFNTKKQIFMQIDERNALERMHGKIFSNTIVGNEISFADLGIDVVYINQENEAPSEVVTSSSEGGGDVELALNLTPETKIELMIDYTATFNEGVEYPPGISRYNFELIHETEGKMTLTGINTVNVVGAVILTIDPAVMPLGNYTVIVYPTKLDVTIEAQYKLIMSDQNILQLYKDGKLIHTQYID